MRARFCARREVIAAQFARYSKSNCNRLSP